MPEQVKRIIQAGQSSLLSQIKSIYSYRSFIILFARRDIKTQYSQSVLGILWSFIQALTAILIVNFFFGKLLGLQIGKIPYALFAFPGMVAWYYFSQLVGQAGTSLMQSQHIIKKVFFPKLILPLSKTLAGLVEFSIWFILFLIMLVYYKYPLTINILFLPLALLLIIITGLSVAIWLSALTIRFRDAMYIIPYLIGFGIFVTPVFFETAMIPAQYHYLIYFNPMAGVIVLMRSCLLGMEFPSWYYCAGIVPVIILFFTGLFYFRKVEGKMVDLL
jgi:lipopolysaccharide transport system permease protein